jgi:F-type H+-transporting ATPase subunit b
MTRYILPAPVLAITFASPALAASGPFFSLNNTDFVVLIAFIVFLAVLVYFKVPRLLLGQLDKRAEGIKAELDEARALREEAQSLLAQYERKHGEVQEQADRIVAQAKRDAETAAEQAKDDLRKTIARRIQAAEDQIGQAEASAVRAVRDRAIQVAVAAAGEVVARNMSAERSEALVDQSIETVQAKLH